MPLAPSYSAVLGTVEAALQGGQPCEQQRSASSSPRSWIPGVPPAPGPVQRGGWDTTAQPLYRGASPSKIPRPAPLALPALHRQRYEDGGENVGYGSMPASPDKEHPAGGANAAAARLGAASLVLRSSVENLPRYA